MKTCLLVLVLACVSEAGILKKHISQVLELAGAESGSHGGNHNATEIPSIAIGARSG